jgi:hypothetical protein
VFPLATATSKGTLSLFRLALLSVPDMRQQRAVDFEVLTERKPHLTPGKTDIPAHRIFFIPSAANDDN